MEAKESDGDLQKVHRNAPYIEARKYACTHSAVLLGASCRCHAGYVISSTAELGLVPGLDIFRQAQCGRILPRLWPWCHHAGKPHALDLGQGLDLESRAHAARHTRNNASLKDQ